MWEKPFDFAAGSASSLADKDNFRKTAKVLDTALAVDGLVLQPGMALKKWLEGRAATTGLKQGVGTAERGAGKTSFTGEGESLARKGNPISPMERTLDHALNPEGYLNDVANKYGINLRGSGKNITIKYDPELPPGTFGVTRKAEGGKIIRIGRDALTDESSAANTIAHELSHARDYLRNVHKDHGFDASLGDGTVYGAGNALQDYITGGR